MSFMLVKGKIFLCDECGYHLYVEYKGGAQFTQVGEFEIMRQNQIAKISNSLQLKIYDFIYNLFPSFPRYLYDVGICQKCYDKVDNNVKLKSNKYRELTSVIREKYIETADILEKEFENFKKNLTNILNWEDISKAVGGMDKEKLIDRRKIKGKRKPPINRFIHQYSFQLEKYIINYFFNIAKIREILDEYENLISPILNQIEEIIKETDTIYISKLTNASENLNNFIVTNTTIRTPIENTKKEYFYYPVEINFEDLKESYEIDDSKFFLSSKDIYPIVIEIFERETADIK